MAEILALPASIAAVMQLADYGWRFAKVLHQFARNTHMAIEELNHFAIQVQSFSDSVGAAQASLHRHFTKYADSPFMAYLLRNRVLENISQDSDFIRRCLRDAKKDVLSMNSKYLLWMSIRWSFKKASILTLQPQMESLKTTLGLLLATAQLDAVHMSMGIKTQDPAQKSTDHQNEILFLKKVIKGHMITIKVLQKELQRNTNARRRNSEALYGALNQKFDPQAALLELSRTMYERGVVPGTSPSPSEDIRGHSSESLVEEETAREAGETEPAVGLPVPPGLQSSNSELLLKNNVKELHFNLGHYHESRSGYIVKPLEPIYCITAIVARNLPGNIICVELASKLHLKIKQPKPNNGPILHLNSRHPERSIGQVEFEWSWSTNKSAHRPPVIVVCEVCEQYDIGLILGKPFLDQTSHQNRNSMY